MSVEQSYIDIYKQYNEVLKKNSAAPLNKQRDEAFESFERLGFPTRRLEAYQYTELKDAFAVNYGMNLNRITLKENLRCDVPGINSYLFYIVNDTFYCPEESEKGMAELRENGVSIGSLREYAESNPTLVSQYYGKAAGCGLDALTDFNTAFAQDGFFLHVPENTIIEKPIQLICVMSGNVPMLGTQRNLIVLEKAAQAKLLLCAHTRGELEQLSNRVTEVFVGENAVYDHYKLENTHAKSYSIAKLFVKQYTGSELLVNDITLHNGLTRNNIQIDIDGEHCQTTLSGMAIADAKQHIDNATQINHNFPNCKSRELYKYVLNDEAVGAFSGKVKVAKGAIKTEAYQTDRNVCMSPKARMYTKPHLEIYADDVKCSHGASTGRIDETALFYLRSRGISEPEARMLLMFAFVSDVLDNIRIEAVKDKIRMLVEQRFRGELSHCSSCGVCK